MSNPATEKQEVLRRALLELRGMRRRVKELEDARKEPVAVIGIGCRFPGGADTPDAFWRFLLGGGDAVAEVPGDRWNVDAYYDPRVDAAGKTYTRHGAFLRGIDQFDAGFFGISPKEARGMDPKQRLLLEVTWEALERAGQSADALSGTAGGVFVGVGDFDYVALQAAGADDAQIDAYFATGGALCVAAGRIAYALGLTGPALSVDTACSSSLVATHLAVRSLRERECDIAVAGGASLMLRPQLYINFCRARMLSPSGRCRAFDASADGYVRGEGCGVVVLKRLSDARANGDPVLAVVAGTAVNQDGASGGLTVPNGRSQERVIRQALADAGVSPDEVGYIEAHGTGTSLGDPIELAAIDRVFGARPQPLRVGTVKTNIGHLEAASGVAGLIKAVLAVRHGAVPGNLHFNRPNPRIDWGRVSIEVPTRVTPWPGRPRVAGVSSFGFSGTNAHVVLREDDGPPAGAPVSAGGRARRVVALSAKSEAALTELAARHERHLRENPALSLDDVSYTLNAGRSHFTHRLAVVADDAAGLAERLARHRAGVDDPDVIARRSAAEPRVAFIFSGGGSQYPGMGRELYDTEPVFREALNCCNDLVAGALERPLLEALHPPDRPASPLLDRAVYHQPALFALEYSLYEVWKHWGVEPSASAGYGVGEFVAACAAGVFSLEFGLRLAVERGRWIDRGSRDRAAIAVLGDEATVFEILTPHLRHVSPGETDIPRTITVSGPRGALSELRRDLARRGVESHDLEFLPGADAPMEDFARAARSGSYSPPAARLVSGAGEFAAAEVATADHWTRNAWSPVRFARGIETLRRSGCEVFVEVGPSATMLLLARRCVEDGGEAWVPSLEPGGGSCWHPALAALYSRGVPIRWSSSKSGRRIVLPTYPFQRQRHWTDLAPPSPPRGAIDHPLLGRAILSPGLSPQTRLWEAAFSPDHPDYLRQHNILGRIVAPAAAYVAMGWAAAGRAFGQTACRLDGVDFVAPLVLEGGDGRSVQTIVEGLEADQGAFRVVSRPASKDPTGWSTHCFGRISPRPVADRDAGRPPDAVLSGREAGAAPDAVRNLMERKGYSTGPAFRCVRRIFPGSEGTWCRLETDHRPIDQGVDPGLIDSLFQTILPACAPAALEIMEGEKILVPSRLESVRLFRAPVEPLWSYTTVRADAAAGELEARINVVDDSGAPVIEIVGLVLKAAGPDVIFGGRGPDRRFSFESVAWRQLAAPPTAPERRAEAEGASAARTDRDQVEFVIASDEPPFGERLRSAIEARGLPCTSVSAARLGDEEHLRSLLRGARARGARLRVLFLNRAEATSGWAGLRTGPDLPRAEQRRSWEHVLQLAEALAKVDGGGAELWLATERACAVLDHDQVRAPWPGVFGGLERAISLRHPGVRCGVVDVEDFGSDSDLEALIDVVSHRHGPTRVAVRRGRLFVEHSLNGRHRATEGLARPSGSAARESRFLDIGRRGALDGLIMNRRSRVDPGEGEVEVAVRVAGLNFRDVLNVLGQYAGDAGQLGFECAGRVAAVGPGVTRFRPGDDVIVLGAPGCMAEFITVHESKVAAKPPRLSFAAAATIPGTFLTAHYALATLGRLEKGERVLIHSAAGGVGLAAVRLARLAGAEIVATAGSPEKREFLLSEGAHYVFDSRDPAFDAGVRNALGAGGVHVALNSLKGEFAVKTLDLLARSGRFLEMGKTTPQEDQQRRERRPDVSYRPFDLAEIARDDPARLLGLFDELIRKFDAGLLRPLPSTTFSFERAEAAFRHMARARHIGKILLSTEATTRREGLGRGEFVAGDGTYLLAGDLGTVGRLAGRWLIDAGVRNLVVIAADELGPEARASIEQWSRDGASVQTLRADVTRHDELASALGSVRTNTPPLKGVVLVADDLDYDRSGTGAGRSAADAISARAAGAWNLHRVTLDDPLELFVLLSPSEGASKASCPAGQAADGFWQGLAWHRRTEQRPGVFIRWGLFAGTDATERAGLEAFRQILLDGPASITVRERDTAPAGSDERGVPSESTDRSKGVSSEAPSSGAAPRTFLDKARGASPERRKAILEAHIAGLAAEVLGHADPGQIARDQPLAEQGFDSLLNVELRNRLVEVAGRPLPVSFLFDYPTLERVADALLEEVGRSEPPAASAPRTDDAISVLDEIEQLLGGAGEPGPFAQDLRTGNNP